MGNNMSPGYSVCLGVQLRIQITQQSAYNKTTHTGTTPEHSSNRVASGQGKVREKDIFSHNGSK